MLRVLEGHRNTIAKVAITLDGRWALSGLSSRWVEQELNAALTNQISGKGVVLPVLLEECELPILLRDRLYADLRYCQMLCIGDGRILVEMID
jgi:hypothetical protein